MKIELKDYAQTLLLLKKRIQEAQTRAALSVNHELIKLYWDIGMTIAEKQETSDWGTGVIETLAKDLQSAFPGMNGFSRSNVFYMRSFYKAYEKVQQGVGLFDSPIFNIPWSHNIRLLTMLKNNTERLWYAKKIIELGWSRRELEDWIDSDLYSREGKAISNFSLRLPKEQAKVAQEMLKDPYNFDVRHDMAINILSRAERILERRYLNQPTYLKPKGVGDHSMLEKRRIETRFPNYCAAKFAEHGES